MDLMLEEFKREGFVILQNVLSQQELVEIEQQIRLYESSSHFGRTDFEGTHTKRIYSLAGKGDGLFMNKLAENPAVLNILDQLLYPNYLLSTFQSIRQFPQEKGQDWHTDDAFYLGYPRPRNQLLAVSVIFAIEDFTEFNGATEVIPRSHLWGYETPHNSNDFESKKVIMPAGSCVIFDGGLWHRGGTNRTKSTTRLAISPQYCQPWLRTQESQLLIAPPEIASKLSNRGRTLLGYSIFPPFLGQVDGMHPVRLCDVQYSSHKTEDSEIAKRVLTKPKSSFL